MRGGTTGLTLGKFAPLHKGHQHLIETALAEVDRLIVMVYDCPDVTPVPLATRAKWIRDLYPSVEVIEAIDGPRQTGSDPSITRAHDDYIAKMLRGTRITHFYSSEFYGEHVSAGLCAVDRRVDPNRKTVPISGTLVRRHPYEYRKFIAPPVYRDLIDNIVFVGAPSTGKTTLCESLARLYHTQWMPEFGREYWEAHQVDRRLTPAQLVDIAEGHLQREEQLLLESDRLLFTDTNALTTALFAHHYHGSVPRRLRELADLTASRYAFAFLCGDDIPHDHTWDRSGEVNRRQMQEWTRCALAQRGIAFTELRGPLDERMQRVAEVMGPPWHSHI